MEAEAGCVSRVLHTYLAPIIAKGSRSVAEGAHTHLNPSDLGGPYPPDEVERSYRCFAQVRDAAVRRERSRAGRDFAPGEDPLARVSMWRLVIDTAGRLNVARLAAMKALNAGLGLLGPVLFRHIIESLEADPDFAPDSAGLEGLDGNSTFVVANSTASASSAGDALAARPALFGSPEALQWVLVSMIFVLPIVQALTFNMMRRTVVHLGNRVKMALMSAIYRKALRLSAAGKASSSSGNIVTVMATDAAQAVRLFNGVNQLWVAPIQITVAVILMYNEVGWAALVGVAFLLLLSPVVTKGFSTIKRLQRQVMKVVDTRVKLVSDVLAGIRVCKVYAWEDAFAAKIGDVRKREIGLIYKLMTRIAYLLYLFLGAILQIMALLIFVVYIKTGGILDAARAFTTLQLLALVRRPFLRLPVVAVSVLQAMVAVGRVKTFLGLDELPVEGAPGAVETTGLPDGVAILVDGVTFEWAVPPAGDVLEKRKGKKKRDEKLSKKQRSAGAVQMPNPLVALDTNGESKTVPSDAAKTACGDVSQEPRFRLEDVSVALRQGSLVAVVGPVGAGKSTLLQAILGEVPTTGGGRIAVAGSVAYVPQQAFVLNASLRENILFGKPYDRRLYKRVVRACALIPDFESLEDGDATEIGERGINLSGGQKQRVSVARACYADADVVVLDDPLSAVDAHVGEHIFTRCVLGLLAGKTRILVTNHLNLLEQCDHVLVLAGGAIVHQGTYHELEKAGVDFVGLTARALELEAAAAAAEADAGSADEADLMLPRSTRRGSAAVSAVSVAEEPSLRGAAAASLASPDKPGHGAAAAVESPEDADDVASVATVGSAWSAQSIASDDVDAPLGDAADRAAENGGDDDDDGEDLVDQQVDFDLRQHDAASVANRSRPRSPSRSSAAGSASARSGRGVSRQHSASIGQPSQRARSSVASSSIGRGRRGGAVAQELITVEDRVIGKVDASAYKFYLSSAGPAVVFSITACSFVAHGLGVASSFFLGGWSSQWRSLSPGTALPESETNNFMLVYGGLGVAVVLVLAGQAILFAGAVVRAGIKIHNGVLSCVLGAPVAFFDVTPMGRIVNRLSKDLSEVDLTVGRNFVGLIRSMTLLIMTVGAVAIATRGFFLLVVPIVGYVYHRVSWRARRCRVEVQRLTRISRSPVYAHFTETLSGLSTIRAFGQSERFIRMNVDLLNRLLVPHTTERMLEMWLYLRLQALGAVLSFAVAAFAVGTRGLMSVELVAVALTYSLLLSSALELVVDSAASVESHMSAVERLHSYMTTLPHEAERETDPDVALPKDWPKEGNVTFEDVCIRYRDNPLAVKGVSANIKAGEHVGVVGRTGSGKSTLVSSLFRIQELDSGKVFIDGVDIRSIGLKDLRSRLGVIPQDPVIFAGSLRYNLDPFDRHEDGVLWDALERVELAALVRSWPEGLSHEIEEGGSNLSVGQRQLVCIARALLRKPRLLVLDEASASLDLATDAAIQAMVREQFSSCTVLTIAHRLNTIMDSDRILVLTDGKKAEFNSPRVLLARRGGIFRSMADAAGVVAADGAASPGAAAVTTA